MADDERRRLEEAKRAKQAEIDRKRAEVRKRMEEASKAKKAKKGFMTPDRKKKLRLLLRKKAAEELKKEQERKAAERRRIIEERCGTPKNIDDASEEVLKKVLQGYYNRICKLEDEKFDLEYVVKRKDAEISDLNSQVNDLRGKFVKPTLKKVSKYENKFAKLQKKAAEFNFRNQLKVVKKKEFTLEEEDKEKKPEWSKKGDEKKEDGEDDDGESESADETDARDTDGYATSEGADTKSEAGTVDGGDDVHDLAADVEPVVEEPQPPSPAPDELWTYLKDAVYANNPVSVDELVEKLVNTVSTIPQPLLTSVVKESIKKQKSIEEEGSIASEGDPTQPSEAATEGEKVEATDAAGTVISENTDATSPSTTTEGENSPSVDNTATSETTENAPSGTEPTAESTDPVASTEQKPDEGSSVEKPSEPGPAADSAQQPAVVEATA